MNTVKGRNDPHAVEPPPPPIASRQALYNSSAEEPWTSARLSHGIFAATLITLGIMGLIKGDFDPTWPPVAKGVPAREVLAYFCSWSISYVAWGCFGGAQPPSLPACCLPFSSVGYCWLECPRSSSSIPLCWLPPRGCHSARGVLAPAPTAAFPGSARLDVGFLEGEAPQVALPPAPGPVLTRTGGRTTKAAWNQ